MRVVGLMFLGCTACSESMRRGPIDIGNISNAEDFICLFAYVADFNADIGGWHTKHVRTINGMFSRRVER